MSRVSRGWNFGNRNLLAYLPLRHSLKTGFRQFEWRRGNGVRDITQQNRAAIRTALIQCMFNKTCNYPTLITPKEFTITLLGHLLLNNILQW